MAKNIALGQYLNTESIIHRLDPRGKVLLTVALIVLVFFASNAWGFLALGAFIVVVSALGKIPGKYLLKSLRPLWFIILFTFVINIAVTRGEIVLVEWWFIRITQEALLQAVFLALRLVFLVTGTTLMTLTTSPVELTDALERLFNPLRVFKFPAHELAMMMSIALRFVPTLMEETDKIQKAQMSRGADFESGNIIRRARNMLPLLVPLFVSAFQRANDLALAMTSRCYHGGEGRTRMKQLHYSWRDGIALLVVAVLGVFLVIWG